MKLHKNILSCLGSEEVYDNFSLVSAQWSLLSFLKKILILQGKLFLVLRDKWNVKYLSGLWFYFAKDNKDEKYTFVLSYLEKWKLEIEHNVIIKPNKLKERGLMGR